MLATRPMEISNGYARLADLRSAGSDRTPRCRPSARDVGGAIGGNGDSARYDGRSPLSTEAPPRPRRSATRAEELTTPRTRFRATPPASAHQTARQGSG